jgi:hypothetical protein
MRHQIAARAQRIWARERKLLLREAQKRLGRTLRHDTGHRGGSGFSFVKIP